MAIHRMKSFFRSYPLAKGMLAYSIMWPTGNIIQQTMAGETWDTYDWKKCARFSLYGSLYVAPTLYGWVKLTSFVFPISNLRTSIAKAVLEQISYGPAATASFFFFMSLMENKTVEESKEEVCRKFLPTMKVGACYWLVVQTVNYSFIAEKNRVPFVSLFGLLWTTFLAYMKQKEGRQHEISPEEAKYS